MSHNWQSIKGIFENAIDTIWLIVKPIGIIAVWLFFASSSTLRSKSDLFPLIINSLDRTGGFLLSYYLISLPIVGLGILSYRIFWKVNEKILIGIVISLLVFWHTLGLHLFGQYLAPFIFNQKFSFFTILSAFIPSFKTEGSFPLISNVYNLSIEFFTSIGFRIVASKISAIIFQIILFLGAIESFIQFFERIKGKSTKRRINENR
jgi:hypothetical protein